MTYMQNQWNAEWVICIQEPYKITKGITQLPKHAEGFWIESEDGPTRALVISSKSLGGYLVTQHSNRDSVTVRLLQGKVSVISSYCDGLKTVESGWAMVRQEATVADRLIVCTDANAMHPVWGVGRGHARSRERGKQTMEIIDDLGLYVCNEPNSGPTYVGPAQRKSVIDITVCSMACISKIQSWKIMSKYLGSDHRAIQMEYIDGGMPKEKPRQRIEIPWKNPTRGGKAMMQKHLPRMLIHRKRIDSEGDIEAFWSRHAREIQHALNKLFPEKKNRKIGRCHWWTAEVKTAYAEYRAARRRGRRLAKQVGTQNEEEMAYQAAEIKIKRGNWRFEVKQAKIASWRTFVTNIRDPWAGIHKILQRTNIGRGKLATLATTEGQFGADMMATLRLLSEQFFPSLPPELDIHRNMAASVKEQLEEYTIGPRITRLELRQAMGDMAVNSAPGEDRITCNIVKILMTAGWEKQYMSLFNACLRYSKVPAAWKAARIVTIPKAGAATTTTKSVRPISLTSVHCKVLERIISRRIAHELETRAKLAPTQHAYRKGGSTVTALYEVANIIESALERKWVCQAIFLDISGAFDRAWHDGIMFELLRLGVSKYLVRWIKDYLDKRVARFEAGEDKYETILGQGCPQGGVLSPLLWNVIFNGLLLIREDSVPAGSPPIQIIGYADDALVLCQAKTVKTAQNRLRRYVVKIQEWATRFRVLFNPAKMRTIVFGRSTLQRTQAEGSLVEFGGVPIQHVRQYKYLGITIESQWRWNAQIAACLDKLHKVTRIFRGCVRESWGVKTQLMRILYSAIFKPIMLYGIPIWAEGARTQIIQKKFDRAIRNFALMSTRTFKTVSQDVLLQLFGVRPFSEQMEEELMRVSIIQLQMMGGKEGRQPNSGVKIKKILRSSWGLLEPQVYHIENANLQHYYAEHPAEWFKVDCALSNRIDALWGATDISGWVIYTDASASSYGRGWAVMIYRHGFLVGSKRGSLKEASVFTTELYAIEQAAAAVREWCQPGKERIRIRTDSQACVTALAKCIIVDPNLRRCKKELQDRDEEGYRIQLCWVPGHEGVEGNECADAYARRSIDSAITSKSHFVARDARRLIRQKMQIIENSRFNNIDSTPFRWFFPDKGDITKYVAKPRSAALTQMVSGHCRVNHYLAKVRAVDSCECECGFSDETVEHHLCECPNYGTEREEVWGCRTVTLEGILAATWDSIDRYLQLTGRLQNRKTPRSLISDTGRS